MMSKKNKTFIKACSDKDIDDGKDVTEINLSRVSQSKFCKDCVHHSLNGNHECLRPMDNLIQGGVWRLGVSCKEERYGNKTWALVDVCGLEGKYFEKRQNVE